MKRKSDLNFDLRQLRSFICVLEEESFTMASRKLKIGQSTISHQINSLEEMLGVTLIDRASKEIAVTQEGKILKSFCEKLFDSIENLTADFNKGISGTEVRLSASSIPSTYILPELLSKINKIYPNCYYNVAIVNSRESIELVKEGNSEVGVVGKIIKHPGLEYGHFFSDEIFLIGPPGSPGKIKPGEIKDFPLIIREKGSGTRDAYEKELLVKKIKPSDLKIIFECTTSEMVKRSVMAGMGFAFISKLAITEEIKSGKLKIVKIDGLNINRNFYYAHLKRKILSRQAQVFITELKKLKGN